MSGDILPVINMDAKDLASLVGEGFDLKRFLEEIPMIGATVEKVQGNEISVEFFPNRPDLFSVEGVARAYREFSGMVEPNMDEHTISGESGIVLTVDPALADIRPAIGGALIRGVTLDESAMISIMNLQEKLHITLGRKRRKVAIGIHDASPLVPPFHYFASLPGDTRFVPLQKPGEEWDLARILKEHEKGAAYADILKGFDRYPVIMDSKEQVLSFPPIINGELTKITQETRDIFVDCTGWDRSAVSLAVNLVCSQLVSRGGKIESIRIEYPESDDYPEKGLKSGNWPEYTWNRWPVDREWANTWLGLDLDNAEISRSLTRMGFHPYIEDDRLFVNVPPWRGDILHQADIAEDISIGYGFNNFPGTPSRANNVASDLHISKLSRLIRETLVGQGFLEVRTISLSNEEQQFDLMGRQEVEHARIINPITTEHTMMRSSSIPSLMALLRANKHRDLPQRIFEIADVMTLNRSGKVLGCVLEDNRASFTGVKGLLLRILDDLDLPFVLGEAPLGCYIKGRGGAVFTELERKGDGPFPELEGDLTPIGHFGEIHPRMISKMELAAPISAFELDLDVVVRILGKRL